MIIFAFMKKQFLNIILSVVLMMTGQGALIDKVKAQEPDPDFYVFLGIGQSNMQGKAPIESQDRNSTNNFTDDDWARYKKMIIVDSNSSKVGTWATAKPPIVRPDTQLGVTDYFGRYLVKGLDERYKIGVIWRMNSWQVIPGLPMLPPSMETTLMENFLRWQRRHRSLAS